MISRNGVTAKVAAATSLAMAITLVPGASPASAATCQTKRIPNDGDPGGVSGRITIISGNGTVLTVDWRAKGEVLRATRPLKEGEHVLLTASWNGRPEAALWPGERVEDLNYWEDQYVNLAVAKGEKVCRMKKLIT